MNPKDKKLEHPEITTIKNICETSPNIEETKDVCDIINKTSNKKEVSSPEKKPSKNNSLKDSANPGNQYISKNSKPKNLEKKGLNTSPELIKKP